MSVSEARTFASVSRVQARLRKLLEPALNAKPFWLRAELSSVSHSKGRLYCDLVEMKAGRVIAKFRCTIWPRDLSEIKKRLQAARLDELLEDGNEVGLRCQIQYHELYGMSVNAVDIDPNASLGALERKKQEIIARLQADSLLDKNAERPVPRLPKRIGLIASRDTAGYKDFVTTIIASGFGITIFAADARVEGNDTERSVLQALDSLAGLELDLIVLLRGGGSRVSLSYMDNEAIARKIAGHQCAVWTAIGHEIDTSVLDSVAHTSFKTPTAVAEHLVARYVEMDERLRSAQRRLQSAVLLHLRPLRAQIDNSGQKLKGVAKRALVFRENQGGNHRKTFGFLVKQRMASEDAMLDHAGKQIQRQAKQRSHRAHLRLEEHHKSLHKTIGRSLQQGQKRRDRLRDRLLAPTALNRLRSEAQRCEGWQQILRIADPARNLERGYALVYDKSGKLLRSTQGLKKGQVIQTKLADGLVSSTVDSVEPSE